MRQFDPGDVLAFVFEHTDVTREAVEACLAIEDECLAAKGILWSPAGEEWTFRLYSDAKRLVLATGERLVDTLVLAKGCGRLAGVPEDVAHAVYTAEAVFVGAGEGPK